MLRSCSEHCTGPRLLSLVISSALLCRPLVLIHRIYICMTARRAPGCFFLFSRTCCASRSGVWFVPCRSLSCAVKTVSCAVKPCTGPQDTGHQLGRRPYRAGRLCARTVGTTREKTVLRKTGDDGTFCHICHIIMKFSCCSGFHPGGARALPVGDPGSACLARRRGELEPLSYVLMASQPHHIL